MGLYIMFYTGLPDYKSFLALYNFLKPRPGFQLNYCNGRTNVPARKSYVTSRGRPRNLNAIDELFLTMNRLSLGLLEKDIAVRFELFTTWTDRLFDYLG